MNDANETNTITARQGHVQALAFAAKGGAALSSLLAGAADAKQAETLSPLKMALFLETNFTEDEVAAIPVVGSKQGETGNRPYDRYTTEVTTKDGKRKVPGSWFTDVVKSTDEWARLNQEKEWITGTDTVDVPEKYLKLRKTTAGAERIEEIRDRIQWMRTALTRGAMLFHHVQEIAALNPDRIKVKMPYRTNAETGETEVYGSKIRLYDPTKEEDDKSYSIGSFLTLKPDQVEGAKTLVSLDKTTARAPKKAAPASSTAYPIPQNVEALLTGINAVASGFDNDKLKAALQAACSKPGKEGDEVVLSVGNLCMAADEFWTIINKRYNALTSQRAAQLNGGKAEAA